VERRLAQIDDYKDAESAAISKAVNGRFKHVEFVLFQLQLNGSNAECCEATLNGVPYADMSYGQKTMVGVDIINVLSEHYGLSVPLTVENAESLTLPIESDSQMIKLFALKSARTLNVTVNAKENTHVA
jgi:hypothetical protein